MLPITRQTKRLIIVVITFFLMFFFGLLVYLALKPDPTCFDAKQNQNEEGVDCGGVCPVACIVPVKGDPLEVKEVAWISDASGHVDVLAQVYNPNVSIGAEHFAYTFILFDAAGQELARERGNSWILPKETKTLLAFGLVPRQMPEKVILEISEMTWQNFTGYQEKPRLNIFEKRYNVITDGVGFAEARGTLVNDSPFDFQVVTIKVVLRDSSGKPVAVNQTEMRTMAVKERRDFRIVWPQAFLGSVARVEMEADADVFRSENFIKRYFPGGRYQDFRTPTAF